MKKAPFEKLITRWERTARKQFLDAEKSKDEFGKRFLDYGALCYTNCARELKEVLVSFSPPPSNTQEEDQK